MKNILLAVMFLLFISSILAQEEPKVKKGTYQFTVFRNDDSSVQEEALAPNKVRNIRENRKIRVRKDYNKGKVYYEYLNFIDPDTLQAYNGKLFMLPLDSFLIYTRPIYSHFKGLSAGLYSIPFRIRNLGGSNFDVETSLSLQTNLVIGFGSKYKEYSSVNFSLGIGLTAINITQENSSITEPEDEQTASALTTSLGIVYNFKNRVNVGAFVGWDTLSGKDRNVNWIYNKETWVGLGINIKFEQVNNSTNESSSNNR